MKLKRLSTGGIFWVCILLGALPFRVLSGELRPMNFDTPTYIEVELEEVRVHAGTEKVTVNVIRSGEFRVVTRVDYETVEGSASAGDDFKASGGTLVFNPGEGYKSVSIDLVASRGSAGEKSFQLRLSSSSARTQVLSEAVNIVIQEAPAPISSTPELGIELLVDGEVKVWWEAEEGYVLERRDLGEAGWWEAVTAPMQVLGSRREVCERCVGRFIYRLRRE